MLPLHRLFANDFDSSKKARPVWRTTNVREDHWRQQVLRKSRKWKCCWPKIDDRPAKIWQRRLTSRSEASSPFFTVILTNRRSSASGSPDFWLKNNGMSEWRCPEPTWGGTDEIQASWSGLLQEMRPGSILGIRKRFSLSEAKKQVARNSFRHRWGDWERGKGRSTSSGHGRS